MDFSNRYILGFVLGLCLVCSLLVSATAVSLSERQQRNKLLDMNKQVVRVAGLVDADAELTPAEVEELFRQIEVRLVDRERGEFVEGDPTTYDPLKAGKDPELSSPAPPGYRMTQVKRLPDVLEVYLVNVPGQESVVLPIHGYGLWTTLYGFIALEKDLSNVVGLTYYEHGETPGLGGEVDNPAWKAQWVGKVPFDDAGRLKLEVLKAGVPPTDPESQVDGLSGATITTKGIDKMLELWLGPAGYGPFLSRLKEGPAG